MLHAIAGVFLYDAWGVDHRCAVLDRPPPLGKQGGGIAGGTGCLEPVCCGIFFPGGVPQEIRATVEADVAQVSGREPQSVQGCAGVNAFAQNGGLGGVDGGIGPAEVAAALVSDGGDDAIVPPVKFGQLGHFLRIGCLQLFQILGCVGVQNGRAESADVPGGDVVAHLHDRTCCVDPRLLQRELAGAVCLAGAALNGVGVFCDQALQHLFHAVNAYMGPYLRRQPIREDVDSGEATGGCACGGGKAPRQRQRQPQGK